MRKKLEDKKVDGVTFFGYVDSERKRELMSRAHAILVPGIREGWGLVVTEANAMGTPAVGYDVHGLRDSIRDGETGILCETKPEMMAARAVEFLRDKRVRDRLSGNALVWAGEFDWERSAEEFIRVVEAVVDGRSMC